MAAILAIRKGCAIQEQTEPIHQAAEPRPSIEQEGWTDVVLLEQLSQEVKKI
ncbi:MAG TPA: hypothetical protein VFJ47_00435 [Terriglobales bacterium]|nr:hypothetical protein [Terriglobales bacterium]